jgi:hypothetical protein
MSDQNPAQEQWGPIFTRIMKDDAFRQQLLRDPKGTLERETGKPFPPEVSSRYTRIRPRPCTSYYR